MTITLNAKNLEFPAKSKQANYSIVQLVQGAKMILKNFNSDAFCLTINFFNKKGFSDSFTEVSRYKEIFLKTEYISYSIHLIHKGLKREEDAIFDLVFE